MTQDVTHATTDSAALDHPVGSFAGQPATPEPDVAARGDNDPTADVFLAERPWGTFEQFASNETVTVKIITVQPGHRLSLQSHQHRGEMWRVLDGQLDITVDDRSWQAQPGATVWVPRGATHRMGNPGSEPARILEVAFGHFDEADIHRLHDDYERSAD